MVDDRTITVVGYLFKPMPGTILDATGEWATHRRFGRQFRVEHFSSRYPETTEGVRKYLSSGKVRGIGPMLADRIVSHFGAQALRIIEAEPRRLLEVEGIGPARAAMAGKIFRRYGRQSVDTLMKNPYALIADIDGVGFKTADALAGNLGYAHDGDGRIDAGVMHVLETAAHQGHVCMPYQNLVQTSTSGIFQNKLSNRVRFSGSTGPVSSWHIRNGEKGRD